LGSGRYAAAPVKTSKWIDPGAADAELERALRLAFYGGVAGCVVSLMAVTNAVFLPSRLSIVGPSGRWVLPLFFGLFYLAGVIALRRGHPLAGRVWLLAVASAHLVSITRLIGVEPGTPFLAVLLLAAPPLFFTGAERRWLILGLAMPLVALALIALTPIGREPVLIVPPESVAVARAIVLALAALLVVLALESNNRLVRRAREALAEERQRSEDLLRNILPGPVAEQLKLGVNPLADGFDCVTVMFVDLVGFTGYASDRTPEQVVSLLNDLFSRFDTLAERLGVEKIKTIGDCYMVASGLPDLRDDHADATAEMALAVLEAAREFGEQRGEELALRIGIHSGRVVAGVIGNRKFAYDLWGDTVNVASRLEATGEGGRIHVSAETFELLQARFAFERREPIHLKGKGTVQTYFLSGRRSGPRAAGGEEVWRRAQPARRS
jgi:adenylate cyclase